MLHRLEHFKAYCVRPSPALYGPVPTEERILLLYRLATAESNLWPGPARLGHEERFSYTTHLAASPNVTMWQPCASVFPIEMSRETVLISPDVANYMCTYFLFPSSFLPN